MTKHKTCAKINQKNKGQTLTKQEENSVREIIKYRPYREYVGKWTPKQIQTKFREVYNNPFRPWAFVSIGVLSIDMVCDAIWKEMSYNPVRFGDKNPFESNDIECVKRFCYAHQKIPGTDNDIMTDVASQLRYFLYFIGKSNPEFNESGKINGTSILINCDCNRKPDVGYKALSCLVRAIHCISTQNLHDYKSKAFRESIIETVKQRHPDLQRPKKYYNYVVTNKLATQKDSLYAQIIEKTNELSGTNARIKNLNEYDPPADTSMERALLSRQRKELDTLYEQYEQIKMRYEQMISPQYVDEI